jgi:predicted nucleotidyltransferase
MVATDIEVMDVIRTVVSQLEPEIRVEKIILFGSYASGNPEKWSDIDIAIISPSFSPFPMWRRQELLAEHLPTADVRLSPLGYTPEELLKPTLFLREIIRTGKVVYQASH